ncbi:MFS transporter [Cellulomonas wangsupingiae]|uniref:MFS transporter n=1 Tax=Cellulomonas wangsupingiae TaxID=2968085 RepID=A0ABY5K4Y9_9CELL|nr:MFS transporter [Cellulomonas wangsupingiae]MCC2333869.1 MFS transporter [Cellulomonas wangsupingiae]UUI65128.1 MFS transporter [Cellulomonas wangsupingiae]
MTDDRPTQTMTLRGVRGFGRLWSASTVSAFGSFVTTFAVPFIVVDALDGDAVDVGLVNAARWVPYLVFGLLAGVMVDRMRRRPVLVATDLLSAVALGAIPALSMTGHLGVGWLVVLMAVFGLCTLVGDAAFQSFVPRVVPTTLLGSAHARLDQSDAVAQVSGPALAGGLVRLLGAPLTVLVDAVSYLASAILLATVKVDEPAVERRSNARLRSIGTEIREGVRWVYRHPTLRPLALSTHAWFACSAVAGAVMVPFAYRTLHLSAGTLGLALSVAGLGALVGASVAVRLGRRFGAGRVIVVARFGTGIAWGLMALSPVAMHEGPAAGGWGGGPAWVVFALGQLLLGLCMGAENTNELAYRQTATPDALQGRMNATMRSINRAMIVVAAPLGGLLGDAAGYGAALVVAGGALVVATAVTVGSRLWGARLGDASTSTADGL